MKKEAKQMLWLLKHSFRLELAEKERALTPLLLAMILFLLFFFASEDLSLAAKERAFIYQLYLVGVIVLQGLLVRMHAPEERDEAFSQMVCSTLSPIVWFLTKLFLTIALSLAVILPASILLLLSYAISPLAICSPILALGLFLSVFGLSCIGNLLCVLLRKSQGRDLLFPLLYFPLTIPVLLCGTQSSLAAFSPNADAKNWLLLLLAFDVIYVTLSTLLFEELLKD